MISAGRAAVVAAVLFVVYYLFRPISKKEENQFDDKNNWRGGF